MRPHSVPRNTALLTGAQVIQKLLSFGYFWYLSNQLSKEVVGVYLFALSFATLFGSITDLGITPVLIRETSRDPPSGKRYLRSIISLKFFLGTLAVLGAAAMITLSDKPSDARILVYAASGLVFMDAFTVSFWGIFKAARNLWYESIAIVAVQLVIITGGLAVLQTSRSPLHLVLTLVAASAVNFLVAAWQLKRVLGYQLMPGWDTMTVRVLLKLIPAFAFSLLFVKIYNVADVVLLGYLAGNAAVANYAIPAKVVTSLQQIIPVTFAAVIFPVFSHQFHVKSPALTRLFERACAYLFGIGVPVAVALVALAPNVLRVVWPAYVESTAALRLMALALPFIFLSFPTGYLLNACDRQRRNTFNRGVILALAIIGNLLLIPPFGFLGSAMTFLATNILLLVLDSAGIRRLVAPDLRYLLTVGGKVAFASLCMATALLSFAHWLALPGLVALGGMVYVAVAASLKIWRPPLPVGGPAAG